MHEVYLKKALTLAETRRGFCAPNPAVGAVLVKGNKILATGYHWASGHPHAEVAALSAFNNQQALSQVSLSAATLYVTLEPCCHFGKTPPCTDLIIHAGIKRVVYGMRDPNPQVAARSEKILRDAGVETILLPSPEIDLFYRSYLYWWKTKKPFITAKLALSLDGKIAGENGQRIALTGEAARIFTHRERLRSDAVLTTAKTIINDDPALNVRLDDKIMAKKIYILDRQLRIPLNAQIFATASEVTLFYDNALFEKAKSYSREKINCVAVTATEGKLNFNEIISYIGEQGVQDLWVEAGGECFAALARANLLQRAFLYVAPKWLSGAAQAAFNDDENLLKRAQQITWHSADQDAICEINF